MNTNYTSSLDVDNGNQMIKRERLEPIVEAPPIENIVKKENVYEFYINNSKRNNEELLFLNNKISTTKYNIVTFLPKALLYQFMRLANVYFVFMTILQSISIISPLSPATAIAPTIVVLSVSLIRELFEDLKRRKLDNQQNADEVETFRDNHWTFAKSGDLNMGEVVCVKNDGTFPADLLLLDSNLKDGLCYIETGTLDGEKTLKVKYSPNFTKGKFSKPGGSSKGTKGGGDVLNLNKGSSKAVRNDGNESRVKVDYFNIEGTIQCDKPNPSLYMLNGKSNFRINGAGTEFPLDAKNLLLKGARLRNTEWIMGIVIYTGHNNKIMKNAKDPISKMSSVERLLNKLLVGILVLQIIISIVSCVLQNIYSKKHKGLFDSDADYTDGKFFEKILPFFTYLLLVNTMIPISLIITLELAKVIQGIFISVDCGGFSFTRKKFITTNSVSLNEELGAIDYIFSDKTGTLTCNKMNLKFVVIGQQCYEFIRNGLTSDEVKVNEELRAKENIIPFENYDMIQSSTILTNPDLNVGTKKNKKTQNKYTYISLPSMRYNDYVVKSRKNKNVALFLDSSERIIEEFWKCLALCHDCTIQNEEYIGMSPDNLELVKGAMQQGFKFDVSGSNEEFLLTYSTAERFIDKQRFQKLRNIEFTSDRKKESVLVKEGNTYKLYTKGADSIIEAILDKSTPTKVLERCRYFVNLFSSQGYRTLYVAMKILTEEEAELFLSKVEEAEMDTFHKAELLDEANKMVENHLILLGCTIVEDKLQEKVPEVIQDLREADIKIWMLTGDKLTTAYNIGLSCNLISTKIKIFFVEGVEKKFDAGLNCINKPQMEQVIVNFSKEANHFKNSLEGGYKKNKDKLKFGILLDEKALLTITENTEMARLFLNIAKDAVAVICCRVSPLQKSQVVKMMKHYDSSKVTLAIGDGGNDVSMIMEAHIGIGIYGEEGLRAAQSSDYAIGEFQVLKRLLFYHGYSSYMRNSMMTTYFFYKNFVFTIVQFFYGFYNDFSGQTVLDDWFITCFNLIFTSIPLAARGITDISLKPDDGHIINMIFSRLYNEQRENPIFSIKNFSFNMCIGILHALIVFFCSIYGMQGLINKNGDMGDVWVNNVTMYTGILFVVTNNLVVFTYSHTWINWVLLGTLTFMLYFIFSIAVQFLSLFNSYSAMFGTFGSSLFWFTVIISTVFCFLIDFGILCYNTIFKDDIFHVAKLLPDKNSLTDKNINKLPDMIYDLIEDKIDKKLEDIANNPDLYPEDHKQRVDSNGEPIESEENQRRRHFGPAGAEEGGGEGDKKGRGRKPFNAAGQEKSSKRGLV